MTVHETPITTPALVERDPAAPNILLLVKEMIDKVQPGLTTKFYEEPATVSAISMSNIFQRSYIQGWLTNTIAKWNLGLTEARNAYNARLVLVSDEMGDAEYLHYFETTVIPVIMNTCNNISSAYAKQSPPQQTSAPSLDSAEEITPE